ncbi:MAG: GDSL-type esterase/lipase family protein [Crocinitomicaceae bacterium]|nr:GDSL-type esterase/lipase family protein [Crocinitomicaceae bacterium]
MRIFIALFFILTFGSSSIFAQEEGFEFVNPPITIVVLGSSTAAGAGTWPIDNAWVNRYRCYVQAFNPENQVINLAKGGYNSYHLLPSGTKPPRGRKFPDTLRNISKAMEYNADGIIINLPSNDVSGGFSVKEQLDNFRMYSKVCDSNDVELWVTTTQPRNFPRTRDRMLQTIVRDSLFELYPNNCIDFWTDFADEKHNVVKSYDSGDGCHLNNEGHRILTDRVIRSFPFKAKLLESSFQKDITIEYKEELSPHMMNIGFNGSVESDSAYMEDERYVKIVQYGRVLNASKVVDDKYEIETVIDLNYDIKVEFESQNGLTKVAHLDFRHLVGDKPSDEVFYPLDDLSMIEIPLDSLNYKFPNSSITVASFDIDTAKYSVRLDMEYVQLQKQRLIDAAIFPPKEGKKLTNYWENGKKQSVLKFKNGQLHRKAKWYNEDGSKKRVATFKNGAYSGKHYIFNLKGDKQSKRIFKDDQQVGETKVFN